ncbi:nascent polypeptide-associated complex protein [Candidatus Woesearchaeota archaeon]|nr:nascent polypeptide-associated complex protein [Candidatus Woesearchaeota archaeon]
MFQGINPKMLKQAMKQMGIKQEELDASEVIIKLKDKNITIAQPSVLKVNMSGQESFQISGNIIETSKELFTNEDVELVIQQTSCDKKEAVKALEDSRGDIAEAILKLKD